MKRKWNNNKTTYDELDLNVRPVYCTSSRRRKHANWIIFEEHCFNLRSGHIKLSGFLSRLHAGSLQSSTLIVRNRRLRECLILNLRMSQRILSPFLAFWHPILMQAIGSISFLDSERSENSQLSDLTASHQWTYDLGRIPGMGIVCFRSAPRNNYLWSSIRHNQKPEGLQRTITTILSICRCEIAAIFCYTDIFLDCINIVSFFY
jgi:hypothetical protein